MSQRELDELLGTNRFRVLIGKRELGFSVVGPLASGGELDTVVLRRALTRSSELYDWRRSEDRRDVTIQQLDWAGERIVNSWTLVGARPVRWSGPAFNALETGIAYEELELAFDDLIWNEPQGA
jgi:phage tail-like protein